VDHQDAFTVEEKLALGSCVGFGRPCALRYGRPVAVRRAHAVEHFLRGEHRGLVARARADIADDVPARDGAAQLGKRFVAAGVVGMHVRVDDVAQRLV